MELTPRTLGERPPVRRPRRAVATTIIVLIVLGAGVVIWQGLTNATLYFYNADEAVARRDELGDDRFRLQGTVEEGTVEEGDGDVRFAVVFDDVSVDVHHAGDPKELFREGIPVVLEGHWDGAVFESDEMLVRHSEDYVEDDEYDERVTEAEEGGDGGSEGVSP